MIDIKNIDIEEFKAKMEAIDGLLESRDSVNRSIKALKDDVANILSVSKTRASAIIKMYTNLKLEGEVFDEELADAVKELYVETERSE